MDAVVGWHVDGDYWGTCSSSDMLTAWIPLHDCPAELGPLCWMAAISGRTFGSVRRYDLGFEFRPVTIELKKGQFSLHHCRAIHGSYPNRSNRPRIALAVHLQDGSNVYRAAVRPDGRPVELFNDRICGRTASGEPDYHDAAVFPRLW